ncbi:MAG: hypothetical protein LBT30_05065 [Clostridiales bacterium]|jgi:hypothetical protein|nr:hypothetical protein [Clostridiales bacterium]
MQQTNQKDQLLAQYKKSLSIIRIILPIVIGVLELLGIILIIYLGHIHLLLALFGLVPILVGVVCLIVYIFSVRHIKSQINEITNDYVSL